MSETSIRERELPARRVTRAGPWAVTRVGEEVVGVSRRCRHQLADLSEGWVDRDGCLVCPWHQSRYDLGTGEMVSGPRGLLWYHGRMPRYAKVVRAYSRKLRLRVAKVRREGGRVFLSRGS